MVFYRAFLFPFFFSAASCFALDVKIVESTSFDPGHVMEVQWETVATNMGHTASIHPQNLLDNIASLAGTDVLIVSSGIITLPSYRVAVIQQFLQNGGHVYLQTEYDCTFSPNGAFEQIVNALGGTFTWDAIVPGMLMPMSVTGTFATTANVIPSFDNFWYSCAGVPGCNVFPFLEYGGFSHGYYFTPSNPGYGNLITTTDQD